MWKIDQLMANAKRETEKGYEIYGYYIKQLKDSNVAHDINKYERFRAELYEIFIEENKKND